MALETTFVKGKKVAVFISDVQNGKAVAPAPVTINMEAPAAAGAVSLSVTSSANVTLRKNTILKFGTVLVLVTADTPLTAVAANLPVDTVEGDEGAGIPEAIPDTASATYDGLHRVLGTQSSNFALTESSNNLSSVTYDASDVVSWDESSQTSKGWNFARAGRFKPTDHAWRQVSQAAKTGKEIWIKHVTPDENGNAAVTRVGRVTIEGYSESNAAEGIIDANWTFKGQGKITETYAS